MALAGYFAVGISPLGMYWFRLVTICFFVAQSRRRRPAVPNRTRTEAIVFQRPFRLKGWTEPHPAGTYAVETEEELIEGLSFPAYRRLSTTITRRPERTGALVQAITIDPRELADLRAADGS